MAKKKAQMLFKLVSTAGTGFFYVGEKSTKQATRKLQLRKYDPIVNMHVIFSEQKLKKWSASSQPLAQASNYMVPWTTWQMQK